MTGRNTHSRKAERILALAILAAAISLGFTCAFAAEQESGLAAEPPPLPLHAVEGVGGSFAVHSAYLVNPPAEGEVFGYPSIGHIHVHFGNEKHLEALTITETLWGRVELGYGLHYLDMGDLPQDIERATTVQVRDHSVTMHNLNARVLAVKEGDFDLSWLPALTLGIHYKYNDTVEDLDDDLAGTLSGIGIEDNDGLDFTLYGSKMITNLQRPVIVSAGLRSTEAAHIGLLGFTGERKIVGEASVCVMATDQLILAAEYRQKPNEYDTIPGLVEKEEDWWTLCAAYVVNSRLTIAAGYAHFGWVLNHKANSAWGVALKYEF